jgi:hypothetical protein
VVVDVDIEVVEDDDGVEVPGVPGTVVVFVGSEVVAVSVPDPPPSWWVVTVVPPGIVVEVGFGGRVVVVAGDVVVVVAAVVVVVVGAVVVVVEVVEVVVVVDSTVDPYISTLSMKTSLLSRRPEKRKRIWEFEAMKSLMSMVGLTSTSDPRLYSATVLQPPPPFTCTVSSEARREGVAWRSKRRNRSSKSLVSAVRLAPIEPSSVVKAPIQRQLPDWQLPDETTRTFPFFSSPSSFISVQLPDHGKDPSDPPQLIEVNLSLMCSVW